MARWRVLSASRRHPNPGVHGPSLLNKTPCRPAMTTPARALGRFVVSRPARHRPRRVRSGVVRRRCRHRSPTSPTAQSAAISTLLQLTAHTHARDPAPHVDPSLLAARSDRHARATAIKGRSGQACPRPEGVSAVVFLQLRRVVDCGDPTRARSRAAATRAVGGVHALAAARS